MKEKRGAKGASANVQTHYEGQGVPICTHRSKPPL